MGSGSSKRSYTSSYDYNKEDDASLRLEAESYGLLNGYKMTRKELINHLNHASYVEKYQSQRPKQVLVTDLYTCEHLRKLAICCGISTDTVKILTKSQLVDRINIQAAKYKDSKEYRKRKSDDIKSGTGVYFGYNSMGKK